MPELSRRAFTQLLGTAAAAAALPLPSLAAPQTEVRLNANENPYGPSAATLQSMRDGFSVACRYPDQEIEALIADLAKLHGVSTSQIVIGSGSGEILRFAALAYTSPQRRLVTAEPTFEALGHHARNIGAPVRTVPLNAQYEHDLEKMLEDAKNTGLIYICNPNNPTATITPSRKINEAIAAAPADTMILVDEAYHHYVTSPEYTSVLSGPRRANVIAMRTFSKVYGMAGIRCGYGVAEESVAKTLLRYQTPDTVNILAAIGARTALRDQQHVAEHRKRNLETRAWLVDQMRAKGHTVLPSEANFVMIDMGQPVRPLIQSFRERGVHVGRLFPAMPNHLRLTIGKPEEMKRFVALL